MEWSLYNSEGYLEPLKFSNGKNQLDVVKEVISAINEGYKIIFIKGFCGTGKCLSKNALIFCKPSNEKYYGYHEIINLTGKEGKIISVNEKGELIETEFRNVRKTGRKKLYALKTRTGREIIASGNHPFLTITEKGAEWLPLKKLNHKSYICLPNKLDMKITHDLDEDKIKVLAHLIAEGKLGDKAGSPAYSQDKKQNPHVREDYEKSLKNLFPDGKITSYGETDVKIVFYDRKTNFGTTNKLRLFIREFGLDGKKSNNKFIPDIIFNLREEKIALFLRILFSCDGSIYIKKNKKRKNEQTIIEYCSISNKLIKGVSLLLNRLGIQHTISSKKFRDNPNYSWNIYIYNQKNIKIFIKKVGFIGRKQDLALKIYGQYEDHKFTNIDKVPRVIREYLKNKGYGWNQLDRFLNYEVIEELRKKIGFKKIRKDKSIKTPFVFGQLKIDFLRQHIRTINNYIKDDMLSFICSEGLIWDKIKSIEYLKEDDTYDLEVQKYNNFISDGIIVHNSAIALNIAKELGSTSIVVPVKGLQKQYYEDYTNKLYVKKDNGEKLRISVMFGRQNFPCSYEEGEMADNIFLPCTIDVNYKGNEAKLFEYVKKNPNVDSGDFQNFHQIKRMSVAPACLHWSPVLSADFHSSVLDDAETKEYMAVGGKYIFYQRGNKCQYYNQYQSYINSDVIIFNSMKYELENVIGRKPKTEVEIIDECDEFLDNLSNEKMINLNLLSNKLNFIVSNNTEYKLLFQAHELVEEMIKTSDKFIDDESIILLKETKVKNLMAYLFNYNIAHMIMNNEEDYLFSVYSILESFKPYIDETYVVFSKNKKNEIIVKLIMVNLERKLKEFLDKNKVFVMMSGTLHSKEVLENIFKVKNYKIVEAEVKNIGIKNIVSTGSEKNFNHLYFKKENSREEYLKALSKCIEKAEKPVLVHVNSFNDLPSDFECSKYGVYNLKIREDLINEQNEDKFGELIHKFKNKKIDILYSTKCNRGVDFPGDMCNSIVFTKFPYPDRNSLFWRLLFKINKKYGDIFYFDKSRRESVQRLYRGLRYDEDKVNVLSPDMRVLEFFG